MVKFIISVFFVFIILIANGQTIIHPQIPYSGLIQKDQLWQVLVVNNGNSTETGFISIEVKDEQGLLVFSGNSRMVSISSGPSSFNLVNLQPVIYNFVSPGLSGSFLLAGKYTICYTLTRSSEEPQVINKACVTLNVKPLSPVLLAYPGNKLKSLITPSLFGWVAPSPTDIIPGLNYDLKIVQVLDGQEADQAINQNAPIYFLSSLRTTSLSLILPELSSSRKFAWQVTARNNFAIVSTSQVWTFEVADSIQVRVPSESYLELTHSSSSGVVKHIDGPTLNIKYYSFDKSRLATFKISDVKGRLICEFSTQINYGENFVKLPLDERCTPGIIYRAELSSLNNEIYQSFFVIE